MDASMDDMRDPEVASAMRAEQALNDLRAERDQLAEALRTSTTMLEALLVQLESWGHFSAVNARDRIFDNEELLAHCGRCAR